MNTSLSVPSHSILITNNLSKLLARNMLFALISCLRHQDFTKAKDFSAAADTKLKGMHHNYRNLMISKYLTIKDGLNIESPDYLRSRLAYYS